LIWTEVQEEGWLSVGKILEEKIRNGGKFEGLRKKRFVRRN
jgi:hypothetical protein